MTRTSLSREVPYYSRARYFYTALRFMVEIYRYPKPENIGKYNFYKTQRCYVIDTNYTVYKNEKQIMNIPIRIFINIKSKDRKELKINMPHKYWRYRPQLKEKLYKYYVGIKRPGTG